MIKRLFPIALVALSLFVFRRIIVEDQLADEVSFVRAFELVAHGRSPYEYPGYLYPPTLAEWGSRGVQRFGLHNTLITLRTLNAIGAALIAWASACIATPRFAVRAGLSITLLCVPQFIPSGVYLGNPSALAAGLTGLGLLCVFRRPALAAIPIGLSLAIKPMAVGAMIVLVMYRRTRRAAAIAFGLATALIALTPRFVRSMLSQRQELDATGGGNISVHRVLALLSVTPPTAVTSAAILFCGVLLARRVHGVRARTCLALTASVFALPRVWGHTLALFVPVLVVALMRMPVRPRPGETSEERSRRHLSTTLTVASTIGLVLLDGLSFFPMASRPVQALLAAVPLASAGGLAYFATRRSAGVASRLQQ